MYKLFTQTVKITQLILIGLIKFYRHIVSPGFVNCCRFYPSCSSYAEKAIKQLGVIKGIYLSVRRLLRCHPFHVGGVDLVPEQHKKTI